MAFIVPMIAAMGSTGAALATGSVVGTSTAAAATAATVGSTIGTVASFAAPLMTIGGGLMNAKAQMDAGNAAANAANYNARLSQMEGQQRASMIRGQGQRTLSTARANIAKSGVTTAGTPMMVLAESAANAEIDAMNALWSSGQESNLQRAQGRDARQAGRVRAGTSLLTTASRIF